MAKLIYFTQMSLDGYIAKEPGTYDWAKPDEEGFAFITELERSVGVYVFGRRMYETMAVWETPEVIPGCTPAMLEFARVWQAADKIVISRSLESVWTAKTRLERDFDVEAIRSLKAGLRQDATVGGPTLAAQAIRAGLMDEYWLLMQPVMLGRGTRVLPDGVGLKLELLEERRFANGMLYLRYGARA